MALRIDTNCAGQGGSTVFRALGHPLAAARSAALLEQLRAARYVTVFDPLGLAESFAELYPLIGVEVQAVLVPDVRRIGTPLLGRAAEAVTALAGSGARTLFVPAFDAERLVARVAPLLPAGCMVLTLDGLKLPDSLLTDPRDYLSAQNFATNLAFFRDADGEHTRLVTANYWSGYGAEAPRLWLCLFDADGRVLVEWQEDLPPSGATVVIDSAEVRRRFDLPEFTGQLFIHVVGTAGHEQVRFSLDTYGMGGLSTTHDSCPFPADFYAGLPAPAAGERVLLWLQNSHPTPVPAGAVRLAPMGREAEAVALEQPLPGFATRAVDVGALLPGLSWPAQLEVEAGRHLVRPRYEVVSRAQRRIAHLNVERTDLEPDPALTGLSALLGKGHILPAPVLPVDRFTSLALPTPMARGQRILPVQAILHDPEGREVLRRSLGRLPRDHGFVLDLGALLTTSGAEIPYGHVELVYDGVAPEADGWLHALFRYQDRHSGAAADTSFGAHLFNTPLLLDGPAADRVPAGGASHMLSTRLFFRVGGAGADTLCHLIYPASTPWRSVSNTELELHRADGQPVASSHLRIPCGGSRLFRLSELFPPDALRDAGENAHVLVRDAGVRLFGYQGLLRDGTMGAFCLDHMFGF